MWYPGSPGRLRGRAWHPGPRVWPCSPILEALVEALDRAADAVRPDPFPEFRCLSAALAEALESLSTGGPVAYMETEYFGGAGSQSAVVWAQGQVALGPLQTVTEWANEHLVCVPLAERAINRVLQVLGVYRGHHIDEFEALGLGQFRDTADWAQR